MPSILFVGATSDSRTDNLNRLQQAFEKAGWGTARAYHQELVLQDGTLAFRQPDRKLKVVSDFNWTWILGFGERLTFLDRMQLLSMLPAERFVNSIHAILVYHNKAALVLTELRSDTPKLHVSEDVDFLIEQIRQGGQWIAKPTAGSFGRDVFELSYDSANLHQILENLTRASYAIVQQRVDTTREQRWYLAMGQVVGAYQKTKTGLRGNLSAHAVPAYLDPQPAELDFAETIARKLLHLGIRAAAVDIAFPYLLDVNFVNPGWFESMESLTGKNFADKLPVLFSQAER